MDTEKQKLYDEVISILVTNVMTEKQRNGKLILRNFNNTNPSHMLYYQASTIISDISDEPIYLNMKLWDYVKFVFHNRKRWKKLKWTSDSQIIEWELDKKDFIIASVDTIVGFVKHFFLKEKGLSFSEFDSIYEQVYGGKEK